MFIGTAPKHATADASSSTAGPKAWRSSPWVAMPLLTSALLGCTQNRLKSPQAPAGAAQAKPPAVAAQHQATKPGARNASRPAEAKSAATVEPASPPIPPPTPAPANAPDDPYLALDRCPPDMALVDQVCVDRWEASLVQRLPDGTQQPWSPFKSPAGARYPLLALSRDGVIPQGYINGRQAAAACEAAQKRLCTVDEWERACRGPDDHTFPYGPVRQAGSCNDDGRATHPVAEAGRHIGWSLDEMWRRGMDHPMINQLKDTVEKTGAHRACTNSYGNFDMVGNLHEWIADPNGTFRGGFFMDTRINGNGCEYATTAHSTRYHDYSIGFRCCKDAQLN